MKHGRRHKTLKEQAYLARKDAQGYGTPYRPIEVAEPSGKGAPAEPLPEALPLAAKLGTKAKKALKWKGVDPDAPDE